jgi:molecular chaperone GrpE
MQKRSELKDAIKKDGQAAEDNRAAESAASNAQPDDSGKAVGKDTTDRRLSPACVAELEARALAAEQQALDMRSRFEGEMRRRTDETRERLNRAADERALGSKSQFVEALLPVMDNLQRSLEAARRSASVDALLHGLERTLKGFESALAAIGVEPVRSTGEPFDPRVHEAVDTVEAREEEDGRVTREYSRGYKLGERLLRPARVQVGRAGTA